jgi:hypothetical protein
MKRMVSLVCWNVNEIWIECGGVKKAEKPQFLNGVQGAGGSSPLVPTSCKYDGVASFSLATPFFYPGGICCLKLLIRPAPVLTEWLVLVEDRATRRLLDGCHRRMLDDPFNRDCIKLFANGVGAADDLDFVLLQDFRLDYRGRSEDAVPGLAEDLEQCLVIEFSDNAWPDSRRFKPSIQRTAQG